MEKRSVNFLVGGVPYSLPMWYIERYPESYFSAAVKKEWNPERETPIKIDRDGALFGYIVQFHEGKLSLREKKLPADLVKQIQVEGDFYNLASLVKSCEEYLVNRIGDYICHKNITCEYYSKNKPDLANVLGAVRAPFCIKGSNDWHRATPVFQSSTLLSLNIDELCAAAMPAPFGKGSEALIDPAVRDAFEISADKLDPALWDKFSPDWYNLHELAPRMRLGIRPYKLVIYKEGGHFLEHRDSVRGENHVGTLVQILNSEFTGGELVVRQNETEVSISKPGEWMAMYGDALHRVNPVTSGTRVALIFDLYNEGTVSHDDYFQFEDRAMGPAKSGNERAVDTETCDKIYAALNNDLRYYNDVVICLTHLYPICQANPASLKGGDAMLYQLLAQRETDYNINIEPVKLMTVVYPRDSCVCNVYGMVVDVDWELSDVNHTNEQKDAGRTVLVVPLHCFSNHELYNSEYDEDSDNEYLGNEAQPDEVMYLITGIRITKRAVAVEPSNEEGMAEDDPSVSATDASIVDTSEIMRDGLKRAVSNDTEASKATKKVSVG